MFWHNWFKRKKGLTHDFTDAEREEGLVIREKKREITLLKLERENELHKLKMEKQKLELQAEIAELKDSLNDYVDDSDTSSEDRTTSDLIKLFAPMIMAGKMQNPVAAPVPVVSPMPSSPVQQHLNDDTLLSLWEKTPPQYKAMSKTMSDEQLGGVIKQQMPNIDDDSVKRAVEIIRSN